MANELKKALEGTLGVASGDPDADATHVVTKTIVAPINAVGAEAEDILIAYADADMEITYAAVVAGQDISSGANNPDLTLAFGDLAGGATTAVSAALDLTATTLNDNDDQEFTLSGTTAVPKTNGIYLLVTTNGTPADIDPFSVVVKYTLTN